LAPSFIFIMEEFARLSKMEIMGRGGVFSGFGVKLWGIQQEITQIHRYYLPVGIPF
jgi:type IV secretory pathway TraG/TraD family ATPase VirD4